MPLFHLIPPLLAFVFGMRTWFGRGGGGALRGSTGREPRFNLQNQRVSEKRGRGPAAPAREKTSALWFREARRCPRALPER